jgi:predicted RNA-binding protein associated with RNAse of E/G family
MTADIQLFRKRHIPEECILLKNDKILHLDDSCLVTSWKVLKPRSDFASGISFFDFEKHWKITRVAKTDGSLYHWYCDIMKIHISEEKEANVSTYLMEDLLIDIVIEPDGSVHVLDLDEAADAFEKGLITGSDLTLALNAADALLRVIRSGEFAEYQNIVESYLNAL